VTTAPSKDVYHYQSTFSNIYFCCRPEKGLGISVETGHLLIASVSQEDFPSYVRLYANKQAMSHVGDGRPLSEEKVRSIFEKVMNDRKNNNPYTTLSVLSGNGHLAGIVNLTPEDPDHEPGIAEIGGCGFSPGWTEMYGREVARAIVQDYSIATVQAGYLIGGVPLHTIVARVHPDNNRTLEILNELGMSFWHEGLKAGAKRHIYSLAI
jgi:RimJ/RimL family protein N-acetyltransferase